MDEQQELNGLIATREEAIDLFYRVKALSRKAQCRQVNCDILNCLERACDYLDEVDEQITNLLDD